MSSVNARLSPTQRSRPTHASARRHKVTTSAAAHTRALLSTARRHADHCRELRQDQRAVPQPSGPRPPLPRSGARAPTPVCNCADAVRASARLRARRAHSGRRAGVVDALLGDTLRWRRVLVHWYPRGSRGSGEVLPAVLAQRWGPRVLSGGTACPIEAGGRRGTPAPSEALLQ